MHVQFRLKFSTGKRKSFSYRRAKVREKGKISLVKEGESEGHSVEDSFWKPKKQQGKQERVKGRRKCVRRINCVVEG